MKYLVTGYNGFIGSNLLTRLSGDVVKLERELGIIRKDLKGAVKVKRRENENNNAR